MSLLSWGMYPKINNTALKFGTEKVLLKLLEGHRELIAHGNGRSYGDSALNDYVVHVRPHDYFIDFDEKNGLLHVQAGVLLSEILEAFVPRGWFLKITPGTKLITVGGAIASDVHGKNHHIEGCFSQSVKEFNMMLADGRVVTCSKTATPELFRATCGGQGLTGIILDAKIHLKKIHSKFIHQTTIKTANLQETFHAFESCRHEPYSVAWIDCLAKGPQLGRCLLMTGTFGKDGRLDLQNKNKLSIPINFPSFILNRFSVQTFNKLYYGKVRKGVSHQKVGIDSFFYPLDAIGHWNRIYGKNGFTQYQFILPKAASYEGLQKVLKTIADSGKGSFLAVLKLYGPANDNYLSFPMQGYSLALDFKIETGLFELLDRLDEIVVEHGGRIYLTKDVRVKKEIFQQGYPHIDTFRKFRSDNQMDQKFHSLQSKRLEL